MQQETGRAKAQIPENAVTVRELLQLVTLILMVMHLVLLCTKD